MRASLIALSFFMLGCGDIILTLHKSVATAALAAGACRDVLSEVHSQKTIAVGVKARAGDTVGAKADLENWLPQYDKVKTACTALKTSAQLALEVIPVIEASVTKKKQAMEWIATLAKLLLEVKTTLSGIGLKLPGGV